MASEQTADPPAIVPWPSISAFPQHVVGTVNTFFKSANGAATIIQRVWRHRHDPATHPAPYPAPYVWRFLRYTDFVEHFEGATAHAHEKYDGTNVSKHCSGHMFGRRHPIAGLSYQKVTMQHVNDTDVAALRAALEAGDEALAQSIDRFVLFGELMCQRRYSYEAKDLVGTWQVFGAFVNFTSEEGADAAEESLHARGFVLQRTHPKSIKLVLCEALRALVAQQGIAHAPHFLTGSLLDIIEASEEFMMGHKGEGLVIAIEGTERKRGVSMAKYKIGREAQGSNPTLLEGLLEAMQNPQWAPFISPRLVAACDLMLRVARHEGVQPPKPPKTPKTPKVKTFDQDELQAAVDSALTKYDALDVYFERDARAEIIGYINDEVRSDMVNDQDPATSSLAAMNEIGAYVNRFVGIRYGQWRAMQAS